MAGFHSLSANTCVNCQLLLVAYERKQISFFPAEKCKLRLLSVNAFGFLSDS